MRCSGYFCHGFQSHRLPQIETYLYIFFIHQTDTTTNKFQSVAVDVKSNQHSGRHSYLFKALTLLLETYIVPHQKKTIQRHMKGEYYTQK